MLHPFYASISCQSLLIVFVRVSAGYHEEMLLCAQHPRLASSLSILDVVRQRKAEVWLMLAPYTSVMRKNTRKALSQGHLLLVVYVSARFVLNDVVIGCVGREGDVSHPSPYLSDSWCVHLEKQF